MSEADTEKNRWLIALSAVAIHLSIGSIYAYSVYQNPLQELHGWSISDVTFAFTVAIFVLGISAAFLGKYVEKYGPRLSGLTAAVLFGGGTILAGVAIQAGSYVGFLATYGVLGGAGLGLGYISPVSTLVEWFPDRRGMATGMAVMGFGAGALITGPVAQELMTSLSIPMNFYVLGTGYFLAMALGANYLAKPPANWVPEGMDPDELENTNSKGVTVSSDLAQLTANEAIKTKRFWLVWTALFINISAGIMLLSVASNMTQEITGASAALAASIVGVIGVFNGAGRIGWASVSDYLGRTTTYAGFFAIQIVAFALMPNISNVWIFAAFMFAIVTCYGGGFACLPAYLGDLFGTKELGAIHGYSLTAWALAGVAGPTLVSKIVEQTGSYSLSFYIVAATLLVGLGCMALLRFDIESIKAEQTEGSAAQPSMD
ncbi:OFA family MFS transporter [Haloterrigena sp. SYSU A121-1]|uniref:OFA family MFS transporter n=1 Tax=Haloterrigena gelatinilytica TaxID=2741724 RepID=A0A8J8GJA2_9EURY|nr:OFA family MFS transporter [Haloterrigena gelatinilytica]NUB91024.1 OFA family MFS transporter [Haloterrigena gelatinilytica]